jgi:transaldolase
MIEKKRGAMNNLQKLERLGQSIWYDNISRGVIQRGELKKMVDEGLLGVTSNPTIFEKAITSSTDYDDQIRELVHANPTVDAAELIQALMVKDIQMACDVMREVYDRTKRRDGYVSIEVSPGKARMTQPSIDEARLLWKLVDRPNLMVKIPATKEGLPAITQCLSEGININVTLIFSVARYREVADAFISGLERRAKSGERIDTVASVASVFVSRIDTLVDDLLMKRNGGSATELMGKTAVANTKFVYRAFMDMFSSTRWKKLKSKGATVQRPLWGSTGTKNPAYSDVLYVDNLIGPQTVNTVPPATYAAILDHATVARTVDKDLRGALDILGAVARSGVDMRWVLQKLEDDGVAAFEKSFDGLAKNLAEKKKAFAPERV